MQKLTTSFQATREPYPSDLETNRLLRLNLEQLGIGSGVRPIPVKLHLQFIHALVKTILKTLQIFPGIFVRVHSFAEKRKMLFPKWLKMSIKRSLSILPGNMKTNEIFEITPDAILGLGTGFGVQTTSDPIVSIIIPVHNQLSATLKLLNQFRLNDDSTKFEIIVVDDASTDLTQEALKTIRGINVLTHLSNVGYLRATNSAIQHCKGKYICLLNNDTIPKNGWLDALVRALNDDPQIAIAGSMLLSEDGKVAEAGSQIFGSHVIWNLGRGAVMRNNLFRFTREVDYCSAASILVDGAFFRSLQGFDERYVPAYYEDADLATTAWSLGRKVVYVHDSYVHHTEGVSHGRDTSQGLKAYQIVNGEKFWEKWDSSIELPWEFDEIPRFEAQRDSKGIIVFFDNFLPSLDSNAGASRAFRIIEAMHYLKFHVVVISTNALSKILDREKLRRIGAEVYTSYEEALENLKMREKRIHHFWISRIDVYETIFPKIVVDFPDTSIIFDTVDLHHLRDERNIKIRGEQSAIYSKDIKERELKACSKATEVVVVSDFENDYLRKIDSSLQVHTLFMPFEAHPQPHRTNEGSFILFVGNFDHTPNVDAVEWLISQILLNVEESIIDSIQLRIVGKGLPSSIVQLTDGKRIRYDGWQESLDYYYSNARFVVVPVRFGAGKKGKLAEAVMHGCPVITTSTGAEGFNLENERDCLITDTTEGFASAISRLWRAPEIGEAMALNAKLKISIDSDFNTFVKRIGDIIEGSVN
jgi:GT2 family glycosyltransferase